LSRRLLRLEIPVIPDRRMFRLHDATVDPDGPGSPAAPEGTLISVTREQMWVASLQEDEAKAVLYLRGAISIDMGTAGKAVESLKLAGGVGDYVVRVFARNRTEVTRRYQDLFRRGLDPLSDEFEQARRTLDGLEQYLLQLWRGS